MFVTMNSAHVRSIGTQDTGPCPNDAASNSFTHDWCNHQKLPVHALPSPYYHDYHSIGVPLSDHTDALGFIFHLKSKAPITPEPWPEARETFKPHVHARRNAGHELS